MLSITFSNMLFSCALLFFLFTTFVAAAPTTKLQKRESGLEHFEKNIDFLAAAGGEWDVVSHDESLRTFKPPFGLIAKLTFTVNHNSRMPDGKDLMVKVHYPRGPPATGDATRWARFDPSLPISGTWERKATGSKIKIFHKLVEETQLGGAQYPHDYYDYSGHYYFFNMITPGTGKGVESAKENEGGKGGSANRSEGGNSEGERAH
ncbi:hypothetical protein F5887DRAFT_156247 [Amanita rubescens]|nr:hypothetical protein F5887DRAFT_156247 [Amanita rubescens]